jgi:hypothetical protein
MNGREWVTAYAQRLGVPAPSPEEFARILDLAGEAATQQATGAATRSDACAAQAGVSLDEALRSAAEVTRG